MKAYQEIVPHTIYDRLTIHSGQTMELRFFWEPDPDRNNIYYPNRLPSEQCFLIERVCLWDVPHDIRHGHFHLHIGAKLYMHSALTFLSIRYKMNPKIMIPPEHPFSAEIKWPTPPILGPGINGMNRTRRDIQIELRGQLYRPIV